jgi:hypothetical protein
MNTKALLLILLFAIPGSLYSAHDKDLRKRDSLYITKNYVKKEYEISMRDGVKLFTAVYSPKGKSGDYPIILMRTPYSLQPYGEKNFRPNLGPSRHFAEEKYIFVYQDVRGRFMSEGEYANMRHHIDHKSGKQIDESSDTYDTVDWLVKNIKNNNGKVGMWGISYPGFYTAAGIINSHPALVAASPQAPIADWFWDDFHHNGAFFLPHCFNFFYVFGKDRTELTKEWGKRFDHGTPDGYEFFLNELGALRHVNEKFYHDSIAFWNEAVKHPNYDQFWQDMNLLPHLSGVGAAVLTVGGWYDAEDLYGPLKIYQSLEKQNAGGRYSGLVMGPWRHGGWNRDDGTLLGNAYFGESGKPSEYFQEKLQLPFFNYYLKGTGEWKETEAHMFETGTNKWRQFEKWPPDQRTSVNLYLNEGGKLGYREPQGTGTYDEYLSDPNKPVPYTEAITTGMTREYMTDDQRFAGRRPDVLVYQTDVLGEDLTLAGEILAHLYVTTSESAADWVVKLIDVFPNDHPGYDHTPDHIKMGGYQQMVRSEVIRGRYRNSFEKPEPFIPNEVAEVELTLLDVLHTFKKGHRLMIQIQSTWFPLVDRNPQKYVDNIFEASDDDFIKAIHRVYRSKDNASRLTIGVLPN